MKRAALPGLILTLVGISLFAHLGIAQATQGHHTLVHGASVAINEAASRADRFPLAAVLAGILFMSGVALIAVSAHPIVQARPENPDAQS
jgi:hypothetical protein